MKSGIKNQLGVKTCLRKQCHSALIKIPHHAINRHPEERHRKKENQPRNKAHPQTQNPFAIPRKQNIDSKNAIEIVNYKKQETGKENKFTAK